MKSTGEMKTYWLDIVDRSDQGSSNGDSKAQDVAALDPERSQRRELQEAGREPGKLSDKAMRLVGWNVEVMVRLLKQIEARRNASSKTGELIMHDESMLLPSEGKMVLDEVKEIITLPKFDAKVATQQQNTNDVQLDFRVIEQLNDYIMKIGALYRDNPCKFEPRRIFLPFVTL